MLWVEPTLAVKVAVDWMVLVTLVMVSLPTMPTGVKPVTAGLAAPKARLALAAVTMSGLGATVMVAGTLDAAK